MSRSLQEITKQFGELLMKAGNLQFEIRLKEKDLAWVNEELREVNAEYIEAKNKEEQGATQ